MNKFKNAAIQILKESNSPMHYKEITKRAIDKGILVTDGKTPEASMNAQLITEINSKGEKSTFIKTAPATYNLNPNKPKQKPKTRRSKTTEYKEKISGGFTGKAGEHYVTSELLFRGYNASIMSVDVGMDVIATKGGKLFSLQVKTSNLYSSNAFIYDMRKVALERNYAGNVFYIFVMIHEDSSKSSLVLPSYKIDELVDSGAIKDIVKHNRWRVTLKIRNGTIYIGTLDNEINYYWDNWDIIK